MTLPTSNSSLCECKTGARSPLNCWSCSATEENKMGDVQGDLAKDMQARGRNPYGTHLQSVLDRCRQCEGSGRFVIPPLPGHDEPQVDEGCARCEGSGKESDAQRIEQDRRRLSVPEFPTMPGGTTLTAMRVSSHPERFVYGDAAVLDWIRERLEGSRHA